MNDWRDYYQHHGIKEIQKRNKLLWDLLQSNLDNQQKSVMEKNARKGKGREDYSIRISANKQKMQINQKHSF